MGFAGGDPQQLKDAATGLDGLAEDLTADALTIAAAGKNAAGAAGSARLAGLAESALGAVGGAVVAGSSMTAALAQAAQTASSQLTTATGGSR